MQQNKSKSQRAFDLSMEIEACSRCPYSQSRANPMLGTGEIRSPVLVVVNNVRQRDDKEGVVLSGRAGDRLDKMLKAAELTPAQVYRTPLIRCHAGREPTFNDYSAFKRCRGHTVRLIKIMRPQAIVVCGLKAFMWLIIKWTRESVDETTFYRWVGKAVRIKDIWGEIKFFVIEDPAQLARQRNIELEEKSVEALKLMKAYVTAQQRGAPIALEMTDLRRRTKLLAEQQMFDWNQSPTTS